MKSWLCVALWAPGLLASSLVWAQTTSAEEKAKASFAQIVKRCSDAYSQKRPERVADLPNGQFVRVGGADSKVAYDISRTQSLVSPLLGVVTVETTSHATQRVGTKEEAEVAPLEPASLSVQKFSFALQEGVWVFKTSTSEGYPIRGGLVGKRDMVFTANPTPGNGPTPAPSYVCAYGPK